MLHTKQLFKHCIVVELCFWHGCLLDSKGSGGCSTFPSFVICVVLSCGIQYTEIHWRGKKVGGHVNLINVLESMLTQMEEATQPLNGATAWLEAASICTWAQLSYQCFLLEVAVTSVLGSEPIFHTYILNWERLCPSLHTGVWNLAQDQGSSSCLWTLTWFLSLQKLKLHMLFVTTSPNKERSAYVWITRKKGWTLKYPNWLSTRGCLGRLLKLWHVVSQNSLKKCPSGTVWGGGGGEDSPAVFPCAWDASLMEHF